MALLGAKAKAVLRAKQEHPEWNDVTIISKLVGYASSEYRHILRAQITYMTQCFSTFSGLTDH